MSDYDLLALARQVGATGLIRAKQRAKKKYTSSAPLVEAFNVITRDFDKATEIARWGNARHEVHGPKNIIVYGVVWNRTLLYVTGSKRDAERLAYNLLGPNSGYMRSFVAPNTDPVPERPPHHDVIPLAAMIAATSYTVEIV